MRDINIYTFGHYEIAGYSYIDAWVRLRRIKRQAVNPLNDTDVVRALRDLDYEFPGIRATYIE